jgi:hypothetical protein
MESKIKERDSHRLHLHLQPLHGLDLKALRMSLQGVEEGLLQHHPLREDLLQKPNLHPGNQHLLESLLHQEVRLLQDLLHHLLYQMLANLQTPTTNLLDELQQHLFPIQVHHLLPDLQRRQWTTLMNLGRLAPNLVCLLHS